MRHMRKCEAAAFDAWAAVADLGTERAPTAGELLNRGVAVAHRDASAVWFHVLSLAAPAPGQYPGEALTPEEGAGAYHRWDLLPDAEAPYFVCAWIYRSAAGGDLRAECVAASGGVLAAFTPAVDPESGAIAGAAVLVLDEAEARTHPAAPAAVRILVPHAEVTAGDVVVEDHVRPME